jgi:hypothetical protein
MLRLRHALRSLPRESRYTAVSSIIRAPSALCLPAELELSWPFVSSVALHVVESTFCDGFDFFNGGKRRANPH